jgi:hypothetical protein
MHSKKEIVQKYAMFLRVKMMVITLGVLSTILLSLYFFTRTYMGSVFSVIILIFTMISLISFVIMGVSIIPIRKNILHLINDSKN